MSTISIFVRSIWNRPTDGWGGVIYSPSDDSTKVSAIIQGHENIGPDLDKSVTILHTSPPVGFISDNGLPLDVVTHNDVYTSRDYSRWFGYGDNYNRKDVGITGINQYQHLVEYSDMWGNVTHRYIETFECTGMMVDHERYDQKSLLGKVKLLTYDVRPDGLQIFTGAVQYRFINQNGHFVTVTDYDNTPVPGIWYSGPWLQYMDVEGTVTLYSRKVLLQRVAAYLETNDPTPIDMQWKLLSKIMDQLVASTNTLASVKDACDALRDIREYGPVGLIKQTGSVSKRVANLWLAYRYSYCTTSSDVRTYRKAIKHLLNCPLEESTVFHAIDGQYKITVRLIRHMPKGLKGVIMKLREAGVDLNAENMWDLVPFSFVVDWFTQLGDMFHDVDSEYIYDEDNYTFQSICFSRKYSGINFYTGITDYYNREVSMFPPEQIWSSEDQQTKTVVRRIIDGASLIISGRKRRG